MCQTISFVTQSREVLEGKVKSCTAQYDLWKIDHDEAMGVMDLEDVVDELLNAFRFINKIDKFYGQFVRDNPRKYNYDADEALKNAYRQFISAATDVLATVDKCADDGWSVGKAEKLRAAVERMERSASRDFDGESLDLAEKLTPSVKTLRKLSSKD